MFWLRTEIIFFPFLLRRLKSVQIFSMLSSGESHRNKRSLFDSDPFLVLKLDCREKKHLNDIFPMK